MESPSPCQRTSWAPCAGRVWVERGARQPAHQRDRSELLVGLVLRVISVGLIFVAFHGFAADIADPRIAVPFESAGRTARAIQGVGHVSSSDRIGATPRGCAVPRQTEALRTIAVASTVATGVNVRPLPWNVGIFEELDPRREPEYWLTSTDRPRNTLRLSPDRMAEIDAEHRWRAVYVGPSPFDAEHIWLYQGKFYATPDKADPPAVTSRISSMLHAQKQAQDEAKAERERGWPRSKKADLKALAAQREQEEAQRRREEEDRLIEEARGVAKERQRAMEVAWARSVLEDPASRAARRTGIPREARYAVFERDAGKCVECGSAFDLQYDHIIPLAMGGSNSVDNLQLLCGECNRRKGATLG